MASLITPPDDVAPRCHTPASSDAPDSPNISGTNLAGARRARHALARGSLAGLIGAAANATAQFSMVLVVTRSLDPASAGAFFTATTACLMLAGILRLDAGNSLIYALAQSVGTTRNCRKPPGLRGRAVMLTALLPVVCLSVPAAGALAAFSVPLAGITGVPSGVWPVLAAALPAVVVVDILVAATRGVGSMRPTVLLGGLVQPMGQLAAVICAVTVGAALPDLAAAWALPALPVAVLAALWLRPRLPYGTATAVGFWRRTRPRAIAAAIQSVFQRLDVVIVAMLAGPVPAAVYTAATRFKVVGQLAGQGLAQAVQARLVRAFAEGDLARARELYQTTTMWLVALTWPIWLGYAVLSPWLLEVFGPAYAGGVPIALVLSATMLVATACGMVDVVLIAAGQTTRSLINAVSAVSVTVVLDVLLVPRHGALGAALGWSGGVLVKNLLPLVQISRRYGMRPFGRHTLAAFQLPGRPW